MRKAALILAAIAISIASGKAQNLGADLTGIANVSDLGGGIYQLEGTYNDPTGVTTGNDIAVGDVLWTPALVSGDTARLMAITQIDQQFAGFIQIRVDSDGQGSPSTSNSKIQRLTDLKSLVHIPATGSDELREAISRYLSNQLDDLQTGGGGTDTDTRLDNPRVTGGNLVLDLYNEINDTDIGDQTVPVINIAPVQSITAGTGISVTNTAGTVDVVNTAPEQTVTITGGTGISATGTHPNFTVTNTDPDQTVSITGGTGISTSGTYPTFTVTNTGDTDNTNEGLLTVGAGAANTSTIQSNTGGGSTVTFTAGTDIDLSEDTGTNTITINSTSTDDQTATEVSYDNISSGLAASEVQTAIDLLEDEIDAVAGGASDGVTTNGTYNSGTNTIDYTVATPGTDYSVTLTGIGSSTEFDGWDKDASDDTQLLSWSAGTGGNDEITLSGGGGTVTITDNVNDADADPANEIQTITADFTGDFLTFSLSGSNTTNTGIYTSGVLSGNGSQNTPVTLASVDDADADATNEGLLSVQSGTSTTSIIQSNTGGGSNITLIAGTNVSLAENTTNDEITISASSSTDWNSLTNVPAGFADDIDNVDDADADPANEGLLSLEAGTTTTSIIRSNTNGGSSDITLVAGNGINLSDNISLDEITISNSQNAFSGSWNDLTDIPPGFADNIDNTADGDFDSLNEGILSVQAGVSNTSIIRSNTGSGYDVTLRAGTNISLSENTISDEITINSTGTDDQTAAEVSFAASGEIGASSVQFALQEVEGELYSTIRAVNVTNTGSQVQIPYSNNVYDVYQIDMTAGNTGSTINLVSISHHTGGNYLFHFQNVTSNGPFEVDFPTNWKDMEGNSWDAGSTYTMDTDFAMSCYFDGTDFYCTKTN